MSTSTSDKAVASGGRNVLVISMGGYRGMCVAAILAASGLLALHAATRIIVVMIALNAFVASFAIGVGGTGLADPYRAPGGRRPAGRPDLGAGS